jgi:Inositol monophosphatase family
MKIVRCLCVCRLALIVAISCFSSVLSFQKHSFGKALFGEARDFRLRSMKGHIEQTLKGHIEQQSIEKVASDAVRAAGNIIRQGSGTIDLSSGTMSKIGSRDLVTECDTNAQVAIIRVIKDKFPTHKFLGEEDVAPGRAAAARAIDEKINEEHLWIIDPIDGTTNFAHGQPLCGVILAYASKGEYLNFEAYLVLSDVACT